MPVEKEYRPTKEYCPICNQHAEKIHFCSQAKPNGHCCVVCLTGTIVERERFHAGRGATATFYKDGYHCDTCGLSYVHLPKVQRSPISREVWVKLNPEGKSS